jgi:hypothetical protein
MPRDTTPNRPTGPAPRDAEHTNTDTTRTQPEPAARDDGHERDDPDERAGLRRPRGGTPNVPRG